jgi:hypothetical protein
MKKFLFLAAFSALPFSALSAPIAVHAQSYYGPTQTTQQQEQAEQARRSALPDDYIPPLNFNFGENEEQERPKIVNQYNSKYKKKIEDPNAVKPPPSILPSFKYDIGFIRHPGAAPGAATLRLTTPLAISGCMHMRQPVVAIIETPPVLRLHLTEAKLELDKSVRYAHFQCDVRSQYAYFELPLTREELLEKNINRIALKSDAGQFRDIVLDVNEQRVIASSTSTRTNATQMSVPGAGGIATFWFYPENTVVLGAPGIKLDAAARDEIDNRARVSGFVPLSDELPGFDPGLGFADNAYFIDRSGRVKRQIETSGKPVAFGTVTTSETYFGPNGQYQQPKNIPIYARLPGVNE